MVFFNLCKLPPSFHSVFLFSTDISKKVKVKKEFGHSDEGFKPWVLPEAGLGVKENMATVGKAKGGAWDSMPDSDPEHLQTRLTIATAALRSAYGRCPLTHLGPIIYSMGETLGK